MSCVPCWLIYPLTHVTNLMELQPPCQSIATIISPQMGGLTMQTMQRTCIEAKVAVYATTILLALSPLSRHILPLLTVIELLLACCL